MTQFIDTSSPLEATLSFERPRLVGLCARITGNIDAAEDLAQETLLEAWRHLHELRDQERLPQWLSGIARNVCLRWLRKRGRDFTHLAQPHSDTEATLIELEDTLVDDFDIEIELERKELIELLDKALTLLPTETRTVLIERYVQESPIADVAERLGINPSAAAMRLQRGKVALRRVLTHEFGQEIMPHGIVTSASNQWEETRIWCPLCGQRRTQGKFNPAQGELILRCPLCCHEPEDVLSTNNYPDLLSGVKGYKPAFSRLQVWSNSYYRSAIRLGTAPCIGCGRPTPLQRRHPADASTLLHSKSEHAFLIQCASCPSRCYNVLEYIVLALPEGRRFWQEHPRIRTLPARHIEANGCAAIVTSFESVTDSARFDVISACDSYEVLHVYGGHV